MVEAVDLLAVLKYRKSLSRKAVEQLIAAILKAIEDSENILANKFTMIECLCKIGDVCTLTTARRIAKTLLPFARGSVSEPTITMTSAEAANPLNPFKMGSGSPKEVQGIAIYALASLERDKRGAVGIKLLNELIQTAAGDIDWNVRYLAFAAARETPLLDEATLSTLLLGTRDRDARVAQVAFDAIARGTQKNFEQVRMADIVECCGCGDR